MTRIHRHPLLIGLCFAALLLVSLPGCTPTTTPGPGGSPGTGTGTGTPPPSGPNPLEFTYTRVVGLAPPVPTGCEPQTYRDHTYAVQKTVVNDRAHLLRLMGVTSESQLSRGQRGLLESYDHGQTQAMRNRMALAQRAGSSALVNGKMQCELIDTTFARGVNSSWLRNDFWPRATRNGVILSSTYCQELSGTPPAFVLTHEIAHMLDNPQLNGAGDPAYGRDNSHTIDERTNRIAAFCEGWAHYQTYKDFPSMAPSRPLTTIRTDGQPNRTTSGSNVTGEDMISVEGIIGHMLLRLDREIPGGAAKIQDIFIRTNRASTRDVVSFLTAWLNTYPGDTAQVMRIFDEMTLYKFSDSAIRSMFPQAAVATYLSSRRSPSAPAPTDAAADPTRQPGGDTSTGNLAGTGTKLAQDELSDTVGKTGKTTGTATGADTGTATGKSVAGSSTSSATQPVASGAQGTFQESGSGKADGSSQQGFNDQF